MKSEKTEKLIKKIDIETNAKVNKVVLDDVLKAFEKTRKEKSAEPQMSIKNTILKSRITKLAVAAVIIVAICFFFTHHIPNGQIETLQVTQIAKSPAELTTFASLTFAYREGGMEMFEKMCDKALKMTGPRPAEMSMQELFEEVNGENLERTEL